MPDVMTRSQRSALMARIRGKNTLPELALRRALWGIGVRYRLHLRLEGARPDLAIRSSKVAVFVDGCFWHSCPIHGVKPKTNSSFWTTKLTANRLRDVRNNIKLAAAGWRVIRFWEHEIEQSVEHCAKTVLFHHEERRR
jgi:DNA mismatch endonuclease (patch repair protein)